MTPYEERDAQIANLIEAQIEDTKRKMARLGWPHGSAEQSRLEGKVEGMMLCLSLIQR